MAVDYGAIGKRIKSRRETLDMTQRALADIVGVSSSFIGHFERAEKVPSVETLARLCAAMDMSMDYLLFGKKRSCDQEKCELYRDLRKLLSAYTGR